MSIHLESTKSYHFKSTLRTYRIRLALFNEIKILTRLVKSKYVVKLLDFEHNTVSSRMICDDLNH